NLQIKNKLALILVSHDLAVVSEMADKVLVMYAGEVVEEAKVSELFTERSHPYTQALLAALPEIKSNKKTLNAIKGQPPDLSQPIQGCAFAKRCIKAMHICIKEKPSLYIVNQNENGQHKAQCWLYHQDYLAQKINNVRAE